MTERGREQEDTGLPQGIYDDIEFSVLLQIAGRMIAQDVEAIGKEFGLSAGHLSVLGMISRKPHLAQGLYGAILAINDATLARYVEKLVALELVARERCENDRRAVRLQMTPAGETMVADVRGRLSAVRKSLDSRLNPKQVAELQANLVTFLSAEGPTLDEA